MKKMNLMVGTLIVAGTLAGTSITANAATPQNVNIKSNRVKVVRIGQGCDINSVLSQLQNCLPGIELPTPELPSPELPEVEVPSPELPEENLSYVEQVVQLVNAERAKEGLAPLTLNAKVSAAAQVRAKEIVTSFSHTRPNGSSFATALKEQNISYRRAGENIAWGQKSPEEVVNAWMNSSGHRANIMNENFTSIGVGYHRQNGVNYWCQLFTA